MVKGCESRNARDGLLHLLEDDMNEFSSPTLTQEEEYVWVEDLALPLMTGYVVLAKGYVTKVD